MIHEQMRRRHFTPKMRDAIYLSIPGFEARIMSPTARGAGQTAENRSSVDKTWSLNARAVAEYTGFSLNTVAHDLKKRREKALGIVPKGRTPYGGRVGLNEKLMKKLHTHMKATLKDLSAENLVTQRTALTTFSSGVNILRGYIKDSRKKADK